MKTKKKYEIIKKGREFIFFDKKLNKYVTVKYLYRIKNTKNEWFYCFKSKRNTFWEAKASDVYVCGKNILPRQ